jgi:hypothetical protein
MIEEVARITHRAGIRSTRPASHGRTRRSAAGTESGCLHDLIPNATVFVLLVNPNNPSAEIPSKQAAARAICVQLVVLRAGSEAELDEVFASLTGQRIGGLIVSSDPFIYGQRDRIIASAAMIEIVSGDADLLSAAALLAYPSRARCKYFRIFFVRTRSSAAASASRSTRTRRPPSSSISISTAFLRRLRRGAPSTAAGFPSRNQRRQ